MSQAAWSEQTKGDLRIGDGSFRSIVESISDAIISIDRRGRVVFWNKAAEAIFGYAAHEVMGKSITAVFPERFRQEMQSQLHEASLAGQPSFVGKTTEFIGLRKDGVEFPAEISIGMGKEKEIFFTAIVRDATEHKKLEQQFAYLADHDSLTGLPNRRSLEESLRRVVAHAHRGNSGALLFLDSDNFKVINDTLGHAAGDKALVVLARLLQEQVRAYDVVARLGGDEFAVLLEGTDSQDALLVAERIRRAVEARSFVCDGLSFNMTLSIGLSAITRHGNAMSVLTQADTAMYLAKERGGNRTVVYDAGIGDLAKAGGGNRLAVQLKEALRESLFVLHYQPVIRLQDGGTQSYEALIRLCDGKGGIILPRSFIAAAERFGLIPQLTRWVVKEAIQTLQAHPEVDLSVNLSGLDLFDDVLPEFIEARLNESGVKPHRLGVEISEPAMMREMARAEVWMHRLKEMGCRVVLDDFGTGCLSFVYLRDLPVDQLKIDMSFIRTLGTDLTQHALVSSMQMLAHSLGKETVAEGVETEAVACTVRDMGITCAQGYHFGKPSPQLYG